MADIAEKVDSTIMELSMAIQNVGVLRDYSNVYVNEIRIAAIYLSAAVIDCLTGLIEWINASGTSTFLAGLMLVFKKCFVTPDFDKNLVTVSRRSQWYATALQLKLVREKQHDDIIEWICPREMNYITPKREKEVGDTCRWFFESPKYQDWVGQGASTLICSGRGTVLPKCSLTCYSRHREITSRV